MPITRRCEKALEFSTYLRIKRQIRQGLALSQLGSGTSAQVMQNGVREACASRSLERRVKSSTTEAVQRGSRSRVGLHRQELARRPRDKSRKNAPFPTGVDPNSNKQETKDELARL